MSRYVTLDLDALTSDEQRSFSMLRRTKSWGKHVRDGRPTKVAETVTPVLTVIDGGKTDAWEKVKADWEATREAGTYTCRCGHRPFATLGTREKGGALFHVNWTSLSGTYGKAKTNKHYIPGLES